jgi:hypothetical protein
MDTNDKDADSTTSISIQLVNFLVQAATLMNTNTAQVNVALQQLAQQNSQLHQQQQALQMQLATMMGGNIMPARCGCGLPGTPMRRNDAHHHSI